MQRVRQNVAAEIGIILPKVRIRDNMRLEQNQYRIKIADLGVAEGLAYPGKFLAMDSGTTSGKVPGIATKEPAFGTPALWIDAALRDQAEMLGYTVVEPGSVVATHLTETVRRHADEILTRDATKHLIDELKQTSPAVVDELIPGVMKLAEVQQILQLLLREGVSIRQLAPILETLGDYAPRTKDPILLDRIRPPSSGPHDLHPLPQPENRLFVVTLEPALEERIRAASSTTSTGCSSACRRRPSRRTCRLIAAEVEKLVLASRPPVVLVSPQIRAALKQMTATAYSAVVVLSYNEITRDTKIESVAMICDAK